MNCEQVQLTLFESPREDYEAGVMAHLHSCKDCEEVYLKIQRLEVAFLNQGMERKRPLKRGLIFSAAMSFAFLFMLGISKTGLKGSFVVEPKSEVSLASAHNIFNPLDQLGGFLEENSFEPSGLDLVAIESEGMKLDEFLDDPSLYIVPVETETGFEIASLELDPSEYFDDALDVAWSQAQIDGFEPSYTELYEL